MQRIYLTKYDKILANKQNISIIIDKNGLEFYPRYINLSVVADGEVIIKLYFNFVYEFVGNIHRWDNARIKIYKDTDPKLSRPIQFCYFYDENNDFFIQCAHIYEQISEKEEVLILHYTMD